MNFRLDIQGLRALAVIFVVIFHLQHKWLPGGFIGVDMFFVISGFLISKGMIKQIDTKSFNYLQFIIGRIKRIVPAYIVMLLIVAIPSYYILIPSDMLAFLYDLRTSLFFYSNQIFAEANNYFGAKSYEKSLLHTWSLSIEMQFYFVLPLLIYLIPRRLYIGVFGIGTLLILIYTQYQINILSNKTGMYFSLLARSAEFAVGVLVNFIPLSARTSSKNKNILALFAIVILISSAFMINENSSFPGFLAIPACLATGLLIWIGDSKVNRVLETKSIVYIGTLSYSLYLWHWPILALYRYQAMRYELTILEIGALVLLIILLTVFSYYVIEEPFRKSSKKNVFIGVFSLALLTLSFWFVGRKMMYTIQEKEIVYTSPSGFNMNNHSQYTGYFLMGDVKKPDDSIVVIGDSHALVMSAFINQVGADNNFNFSYLSTNYVPPLKGINDEAILDEYKKEYYDALPKSKELITRSKIIIVVKNWSGDNNDYFSEVLNELISEMSPNQNLILLSDFPSLEINPMRQYKSIVQPADFKNHKVIFPKIPQQITDIVEQQANVYIVNLNNQEYFKNAPYYNDTLMYYDENHLNQYGSVNYAKFEGYKLAELIKQIKLKN